MGGKKLQCRDVERGTWLARAKLLPRTGVHRADVACGCVQFGVAMCVLLVCQVAVASALLQHPNAVHVVAHSNTLVAALAATCSVAQVRSECVVWKRAAANSPDAR